MVNAALCQTIGRSSIQASTDNMEAMIRQAVQGRPDLDLIVFPEYCYGFPNTIGRHPEIGDHTRRIAALAKEHGLLLIVDNTFLSPYLQNPLPLGADIVLHSGSKFISGHNDTIAGFLTCADQELADRVRLIAKTTGGMLAPFDCWLTIRGLKTLSVRMERQQANALAVARWLQDQPGIEKVFYVGLPEHPGYAVNAAQAKGSGSMISFRTDTVETAHKILNQVKLITFAESLGGTESLITYPLTQTHPDVPEEMRQRLGITDTLLRLSVGLEYVDDIICDLKQALEA